MKKCPLHPKYGFKSKCRITTCKMYTQRTENHCMLLDTSFSPNDKQISDTELMYYKKPDKDVKEVSSLRKKVVNRAQATLALYAVTEAIRTDSRCDEEKADSLLNSLDDHSLGLLKKACRSKTFNIKYLNLERWMMAYVLNKEYAESALPGFSRHAIHLLFRWTPAELDHVQSALTKRVKTCPE